MKIVLGLIISTISVLTADYFLQGVTIDNIYSSVITAVSIGVLNTFLKPILVFLTLPITILSLGLFYFLLNGIIVLIVDAIIPGFSVNNIVWALLFSLIISLTSWLLGNFFR